MTVLVPYVVFMSYSSSSDSTGRVYRRVGDQELAAIEQMSPPTSVPPATAGSTVSGLCQLGCASVQVLTTVFVQASAKKMMLLSNEARKEMAKQARAVKEERRAALDARHRYLVSRLADAVALGQQEVEDALISDEKVA